MLSAHFGGKQSWQSRDQVGLPSVSSSQSPTPCLTTFAFRSSGHGRWSCSFWIWIPYGGTDPLGMFPLFLKKTAEVLAPHLTVVFWWLFRLGSFPVCWRVANVTPILKGLPSSSTFNYRPISLRGSYHDNQHFWGNFNCYWFWERTLLRVFKKKKLRWKLSAWHVFECLCMRWIFKLPEMAKIKFWTFQA